MDVISLFTNQSLRLQCLHRANVPRLSHCKMYPDYHTAKRSPLIILQNVPCLSHCKTPVAYHTAERPSLITLQNVPRLLYCKTSPDYHTAKRTPLIILQNAGRERCGRFKIMFTNFGVSLSQNKYNPSILFSGKPFQAVYCSKSFFHEIYLIFLVCMITLNLSLI